MLIIFVCCLFVKIVFHVHASVSDILYLEKLWLHNYGGDLFDCQDTNKVFHYKANVELGLCCACRGCDSNQNLLTIRKEDPMVRFGSDWNLTYNGVSGVILTIPAPQESDSGGYACFYNGSRISSLRSLHIIGSVDAPKISSVISTIKGNLTVQFNPGRAHRDMSDKFTVSIKPGNVLLCTNETISCVKKKCKCSRKIQTVKDENVTIVILKQRSVQRVETTQTLNLIKHIKLGSVTNLNIERINTTFAHLEFCAPKYAFMVIDHMTRRNCPLSVSVQMIKTQGYNEERQIKVTFVNERTCVQIPLSHLTPFTRYNLSVTTGSCGGTGQSKNISFTSNESAPLSSPQDISYWIVEETISKDNKSHVGHKSHFVQQKFFSLNLNWKPIPHEESGGEISYKIRVFNDKWEKKLNSTEPYVIAKKIPDTSVFVEIYARNKMGKSNSSYLTVHRDSVDFYVKQLESHVEIDGSKANIFIQEPPTDIEISGIYTCVGYVDRHLPTLTMCKEPPRKISNETSFSHKHDSKSAVVRIMNKDCAGKSTTVYRQEVCSFYENRTQNLNVSVTTMETASCSLPSSHDQLKFLFSVKKNGRTIPRLFPFKCYYDNKLDTVKLNFKQTLMKDGISLSWKQFCDFNHPQQFLAHSYRVYKTKDRQCQKLPGVFTEIGNKIIQPSVIEISQKDIYACIQSFKTSHKAASDIMGKHIVRGESDKNVWILVGVILVVVAVLVVVAIVITCRRFRKRKAKVSDPLQRGDRVYEILEIVTVNDTGYIDISNKDSSYLCYRKEDSVLEDKDSSFSSLVDYAYENLDNLDSGCSSPTRSEIVTGTEIDSHSSFDNSQENKSVEKNNQPVAHEENLQCGEKECMEDSNNLDSACFTHPRYEIVTGSEIGSSSSFDNSVDSKCHEENSQPIAEEEDKVVERLLKDMQQQSQL